MRCSIPTSRQLYVRVFVDYQNRSDRAARPALPHTGTARSGDVTGAA
jgi:hypothetical protein